MNNNLCTSQVEDLKIEIIVLKDQISLYKKDIEKLEAIRKEYKQFKEEAIIASRVTNRIIQENLELKAYIDHWSDEATEGITLDTLDLTDDN